MILTVRGFRERIEQCPDQLVSDLQMATGRFGQEEADAWLASLSELARLFANPVFEPLPFFAGAHGHVFLEYHLPASSSWCDFGLLGRHRGKASAVFVELK